MTIAFEQVLPAPDFRTLPVRLELRASRASAAIGLVMLAPMMALLAVPLAIFTARAQELSATDAILGNPLAAVQAFAGILVWAALFVWPLKRIVTRLGAARIVEITETNVSVTDRTPFNSQCWSAPLAQYSGIAHHIRASLSGNRHELIMVHPDASKSILIAASERISSDVFDRAKSLLGLPEVPAARLYGRA